MQRFLSPLTAFRRLGLGVRTACFCILACSALLAVGVAYLRHLHQLDDLVRSPQWAAMVPPGGDSALISLNSIQQRSTELLWYLVLTSTLIIFVAIGGYRATLAQITRMRHLTLSVTEDLGPLDLTGLPDDALMNLTDDIRRARRRVGRKMNGITAATDEMFNAANELSEVARHGSKSSLTQSEAVARIAASIEEMSTSVNAAAEDATNTDLMSEQSHALSSKGNDIVAVVVREIKHVEEAVKQAIQANSSLEERSMHIGKIIDVIDDISEQTNMLALNAAIEAARAGEHGRGFAVVADEVRSLAQRTRESTQQIADLIGTIQSETRALVASMEAVNTYVATGVNTANDAGVTLRQIKEQTKDTRDMIHRISQALVEQGAASEDIAANVEHINHMSLEHKSVIEQTATTADYLLKLSQKLQSNTKTALLHDD